MSIFSKSTAGEIEDKIRVYDSQTFDLNTRVGELKRKLANALLQEDPATRALRKELRDIQDELEAREIGREALQRELRSARRRACLLAIEQDRKAAADWVKTLEAIGEKLRAAFEGLAKRWTDFYQATAEIPPLFRGSRRPAPMLQNVRSVMTRFFSTLADFGSSTPRDDPNEALARANQCLEALVVDFTSILEQLSREQRAIIDEEEAADRDPLAPPDAGRAEKVEEAS